MAIQIIQDGGGRHLEFVRIENRDRDRDLGPMDHQ